MSHAVRTSTHPARIPSYVPVTTVSHTLECPQGRMTGRWGDFIQYTRFVRVPERPTTPVAARCFDAHKELMLAYLASHDTRASETERDTARAHYLSLITPAGAALMELVRVAGSLTGRQCAEDGEHAAWLEYHAGELTTSSDCPTDDGQAEELLATVREGR